MGSEFLATSFTLRTYVRTRWYVETKISIRRVLFTIDGDLCLRAGWGRARGMWEEGKRGWSEGERNAHGRLASQFPAARYIYEDHKVAGTAAYIAA